MMDLADFLDTTNNKEQIDILDFLKINNFHASKNTTKMGKKTAHRVAENICESYFWWGSIVSGLYKELLQLNSRKDKQPNFKMGKEFEKLFLWKWYTHGQQAQKRELNILSH